MIRRGALIAAAAAALLLAPAAATAASGGSAFGFQIGAPGGELPLAIEDRDIPARITGRLIVSFHGDQASGCRRRGVCGYSGTIVWTPAHPAVLDVEGFVMRKRTQYSVDLEDDENNSVSNGGGTIEADVRDAGAVCADAAYSGSDLSFPVLHRSVHVVLIGGGLPSLFQTRCAGPLQSDLAKALPARRLPLPELVHGERTIGLRGDRRFASHGFAGTVASTLSLSLASPGRWQRQRFKVTRQHQREVTIAYRATVTGELTADVSGDADEGLCGPLGACGLSGKLSVRLPAVGTAQFTAATLGRHSSAELLRALRSGHAPKGISIFGFMEWRRGGRIVASMQGPDGFCKDSAGAGGAIADVLVSHRALKAEFVVGDESADELRTRCPGPFAPQQPLATGKTTSSIIGQPTATIPVTSGSTFSDDGYNGRSTSTLRITLSHRRIERRPRNELITIAG